MFHRARLGVTFWGRNAGQAFALGWLERKTGQYLQPSPSLSYFSRSAKQSLAGLDLQPGGYSVCGS
jgi:hypothetical protein